MSGSFLCNNNNNNNNNNNRKTKVEISTNLFSLGNFFKVWMFFVRFVNAPKIGYKSNFEMLLFAVRLFVYQNGISLMRFSMKILD